MNIKFYNFPEIDKAEVGFYLYSSPYKKKFCLYYFDIKALLIDKFRNRAKKSYVYITYFDNLLDPFIDTINEKEVNLIDFARHLKREGFIILTNDPNSKEFLFYE